MKLKNSSHPYALVTILFRSVSYVLTTLALSHFSPFSLGFLRYLFASVALVTAAIILKIKVPQKQDLLWFAVSGAVGFFLYMIAFNQGQGATTPATASVTAMVSRKPCHAAVSPEKRLIRSAGAMNRISINSVWAIKRPIIL